MEYLNENIDIRTPAIKQSEAIRDGDEVAFSQFYEASVDRLLFHVEKVTNDFEEAQNVVHDTFVKLWQQRAQIDPNRSLDGLVSTMAMNAALNLLRKKQTHSRYYDEQIYLQNGEDLAADVRLITRETERRIRQIIRAMPPQRRRVFELSRDENLTYNEIAERMGLSYNTVRNYMAAALDTIRAAIMMVLAILLVNSR